MDNKNLELEKQKLCDFEILRNVVQGSVNIKDLDKDLKLRLIDICNNRLIEVNKKIEDTNNDINRMKKIIDKKNKM